jgi:MFS family permease
MSTSDPSAGRSGASEATTVATFPSAPTSPWAPLAHPAFRVIWVASLVANLGTWMQTVGAQWLLVEHSAGSTLVALVQSASSLPVLLLTLPAGVLAEFLDRRRLLLAAQGFQLAVAAVLAALTVLGLTSPALLLVFTFLLGCGTAAQIPAYQAFIPDLVPRSELGPAAALGSISVNLARAVGPALAGALVPVLGVSGLFAANAVSFAVFAVALLRAPASHRVVAGSHGFLAGLEAGGRYVRHAPRVRRLLVRLVTFTAPANILWALLVLVAHDRLGLSAAGYGLLLGAAGIGSVAGALLLPRLRRRLSATQILLGASVLSGAAMVVVGTSRSVPVVLVALLPAGAAWIAVIAGMNSTLQAFLPTWVRARALSIYQLVLFTTFAASALLWGAIASRVGVGPAFTAAGILLLVGAGTVLRWPLLERDPGDRSATATWSAPEISFTPDLETSPVEITISYHVPVDHHDDFLALAVRLRDSRRRTGATSWTLARAAQDGATMVERYRLPSWEDYQQQNTERLTGYDRDVVQEIDSLAQSIEEPRVELILRR